MRFLMRMGSEERRNRAETPAPGATLPRQRPSPPRANRAVAARTDARTDRAMHAIRNAFPRKRQVMSGIAPRPRQVFGLVNVGAFHARLLFAASRLSRASACGEGRFHIPLRGSAGISPRGPYLASLLNPSLHQDEKMNTVGGAHGSRIGATRQRPRRTGAGRRGGWPVAEPCAFMRAFIPGERA